jgi:hypothetical protein
MPQDLAFGSGSEPTAKSIAKGNGHSTVTPGTVAAIPSTVIPDESEGNVETRRHARSSHRVGPPVNSRSRRATSQPEPTVVDFVELKDGSLVDIVEDPENSRQTLLALWKDGNVTYHHQLKYDGRQLIPRPRTGKIMRHILLPREVKPYNAPICLMYELVKLIQRCASIKEEDDLLPLASFILASWVVDRLPVAPYLAITGLPQSGKTTLLSVLSLVCRRALHLANTSPAAVYQACDQFMPTLLIDDCDPTDGSRELRQLLRVGTTRGAVIMRNNKLFHAYGMKAIAWNEPPSDLAINTRCVQIEMVESNSSDLASVTDEETQELASELRAQLLQYRFEHYSKIRIQALPDEDRLRPRSRDLLRCLAALSADEPKVCVWLTDFFKNRDILKREPLPPRESAVLAALFSEIHQTTYTGLVRVKDLTESVNKILWENGERFRLKDRKVGAVLTSFGIRHRQHTAYGTLIVLEKAEEARIHKLASAHGIEPRLDDSVRYRQKDCHLCCGRPRKNEKETAEVGG